MRNINLYSIFQFIVFDFIDYLFFSNRDVDDSKRVDQFGHGTGNIQSDNENNIHGYDVAGNAHMSSAYTVSQEK